MFLGHIRSGRNAIYHPRTHEIGAPSCEDLKKNEKSGKYRKFDDLALQTVLRLDPPKARFRAPGATRFEIQHVQALGSVPRTY